MVNYFYSVTLGVRPHQPPATNPYNPPPARDTSATTARHGHRRRAFAPGWDFSA